MKAALLERVSTVWNSVIMQSYQRISGKMLVLALVIFLFFLFQVLPAEVQRSQQYFGDSTVPDTSLIYSGEDLYQMAGDFGQAGRAYYVRSRFTFDVVWPMAYGFFLWAATAYFGRPLRNGVGRYTILLPFMGVFLDLLENTGASLVMRVYPDRIPLLLAVVPLFTLSKWLVIGASFASIVVLAVACVFRR